MYYNLKSNVYIPNLFKEICKIVKNCLLCKRCKLEYYVKNKRNTMTAKEKLKGYQLIYMVHLNSMTVVQIVAESQVIS